MIPSSRAAVLGRIRGALGRRSLDDMETLQRRQDAPPVWTRPHFDGDDVERFVAKAEASLCSVERIASRHDIAAAVTQLLEANGLPANISVAPVLGAVGWPEHWQINFGAGRVSESLAVTDALAGIAETGSLVVGSDADRPSSLNFLPELHVAVLQCSDVVHHMEDVWPKLRALPVWPRAVNIISAPSRTADVAQIVVRPAHGPKDLHILLVEAQE